MPGAGFAVSPGVLSDIERVVRQEAFDVVHAHASVVSPVAYAGAVAGVRAGMPTVLTFHSMLHRSAALLGASEALFGWIGQGVVLSAVSSVVAAQAAHWLPGVGVAVLPNGVDTGFWRGAPPRTMPSANDAVLFVSAMRLSRKKRPARLLRAFAAAARFANGAPAMRLAIAGDGPDRTALLRAAMALGIANQVELPGHLDRDALRAMYGRADVFVLPSERESFGIAALEARAAGLPVIAMRESGARDFIRQGVDGLLAGDERELSQAMGRLAVSAPFRAFVARHNASAPPPYDWADVAAMHEAIYAAAAERSLTRRASQR
jgi:glycosyltransferase involved in cell wall biosynthesis